MALHRVLPPFLFALLPVAVLAATHQVPSQFPTIQAAIDAAQPGDSVEVKAGDYNEALVLKSGITLTGEGRDKVFVQFDGTQQAGLCVVGCKGVVVQGIAFRANHPDGFAPDVRDSIPPVCLVKASTATLRECAFSSGAARGMSIVDRSDVTITSCVVSENYYTGIWIDTASRGLIEHSSSTKNQCGIAVLGEGTEVTANDNECASNRISGISAGKGALLRATGNRCLSNGEMGITVVDLGTHAVLRKNTCKDNEWGGIWYHRLTSVDAKENNVAENVEIGVQDVQSYFYERDFKTLEAIAERLRANKVRFKSGEWQIAAFYDFLADPCENLTAEEAETYFSAFDEWKNAYPESVTRRLALVHAYRAVAWKLRGGGYIDSVSQEAWAGFQEYLDKAQKLLIEAAPQASKDPVFYVLQMKQAREYSPPSPTASSLITAATQLAASLMAAVLASPDSVEIAFKKGIAVDPEFYPLYYERTISLLPRWGGSARQLIAFVEESDKQTQRFAGAAIYARVANTVLNCEATDVFLRDYAFSWLRIKAGYDNILKTFPESRFHRSQYCRMACTYDDKDTAAKLFTEIDGKWDSNVWRSPTHFDVWRKWALESGPRPGTSPLSIAIAEENAQEVRRLLDQGSSVNAADEFGCPVLYSAISTENPAILRELLKRGADPNQHPEDVPPAIFKALNRESNDYLAILLESKADPNSKDLEGWTALTIAISWQGPIKVPLLLDYGADPNLPSVGNVTPLLMACEAGDRELVQLLIDRGAMVNSKANEGATPLLSATTQSNLALTRLLLDAGADPNLCQNDGWSPLMAAADRGNLPLVQFLVEKGSRIDQVQLDGWSVLHTAAKSGAGPVLEYLLEKKPEGISTLTKDGRSVLQQAAKDGQLECVKILLDHGADINYRNPKDSKTALGMAQTAGHADIVQLLQKRGAIE